MPDRSYEGVVVLGSPRSGTTLLRRLLSAHPSLHCPPETYLLASAARFMRTDRFAGGLGAGSIPGLIFSGYEEAEILRRLREFVFSFLQEIREREGKAIWVEKTAVSVFHLPEIRRLCGDTVRYVCITRHGIDVACSMKELSDKMEAYLAELHRYVAQHQSPLAAFAHAWCDANGHILELIEDDPERAILVRYEDLIDDAPAQLERVFAFLGLETDVDRVVAIGMGEDPGVGLGDWKTYADLTFRRDSIGRFERLDATVRSELARIVNPMMRRLGYEEVPADEPSSIADACHAYQINQMVRRMKERARRATREKD